MFLAVDLQRLPRDQLVVAEVEVNVKCWIEEREGRWISFKR